VNELRDSRLTIIGLGLMGGSLAGALRGKCLSISGVARRQETIDIALERELIDTGTSDLPTGVAEADVVVVATPARVILRQLDELAPLLKPGCVLMDMGSTKQEITAHMSQLPEHIQPLGGHPMCGREVSGIEAADPSLFQGNPFVLTPLTRTSDAALKLGYSLAETIGALPLVLNPAQHDKLVALISHLPYLLACSLVATAQSAAASDPTVWELASSGFRDTSRLAASDVTMMLDLLMTNRGPALDALREYQVQLASLTELIEARDENRLRDTLSSLGACRRSLFQ
jgi:prephenate dehydrogenase